MIYVPVTLLPFAKASSTHMGYSRYGPTVSRTQAESFPLDNPSPYQR